VDPDAVPVILRGIELFNRGEYEAAIATLPPEMVWDTSAAVPDGAAYEGGQEVLGYWREIGERWDDFRIEVEQTIEGDGVVLLLGRLIGRGVGSGVPVEHSWDQVWTVQGAVPVRCENFTDRDQAWRAAGIEPEA
jgi:ketosteroid isomerase-like protein